MHKTFLSPGNHTSPFFIFYIFDYLWVSLRAQLVKNLPALQETLVRLTTGSERSPGEGIDYPLQYSWSSLVTQLVKNIPAMPETWVQSPGWEDTLEKGKTTYSSILACRIHRGRRKRMTFTSTLITYGHCPFFFFNEFCLWEWVALLILLLILERRCIFLSYSFNFIF